MEQAYGTRLARARRRRRRRMLGMWFFTLCTVAALLAVGWMVVRLDRLPGPSHITTTAETLTRVQVAMPVIKDGQAALTYDRLGSPWRSGCPASSSFTWTAGEDAVAGRFRTAGGQSVTWHGSACSGPLPVMFSGIGLRSAADAVLHAIDPLYYGVLPHSLHVTASRSVRVAGTKAWRITFVVRYRRHGLPWSSEQGAIVVTSHGAGSLYYVSVPGDFSPWIYQALVASLR